MVYLDVYDRMLEYLEKTGVVDDVFDYCEDVLKPVLQKVDTKGFHDEMILEFALFNYRHENRVLIAFLGENMYNTLSGDERKEFDLVLNSERRNLKFEKKQRTNELDNGKELYDFYYTDAESNETKIVRSSSSLENNGPIINARLIESPLYGGRYSLTGGIFDAETFKWIQTAFYLRMAMKGQDKAEAMIGHLLKFSREHSLEDIKRYENKESGFIRQDRKIMEINRMFFEKFGCGFDDFLGDFYALSNRQDRFIEMAEYYLAIEDELFNTIMDTNYFLGLSLFPEGKAIKGFIAFLKNDAHQMEDSIRELQNEGKKEFEARRANEIALARENVLENQKKFLRKRIAPLHLDGFDSLMERLDAYAPDRSREFLGDIVGYLDKHWQELDSDTSVSLSLLKGLLHDADKMPYLKEILERQRENGYDSGRFYDYIGTDDSVYSLHVFLSAAYLFQKKDFHKAYRLIKEKAPEKTDSFAQLFFLGKVLSLFEDNGYKPYFSLAKKIDKARYAVELRKFLEEKQRHLQVTINNDAHHN